MALVLLPLPLHLAFPEDKTVFATSAADTFDGATGLMVGFDNDTSELLYYVDPITNEFVGNTSVPSFDVFEFSVPAAANIAVNYSFSPSAIFIDLAKNPQHGGTAEGDTLVDIYEIVGSGFNDVIRGSNLTGLVNDPGDNILIGGGGDDVLEGRGGADILVGGSFTADFGFDFASYESSPAAVTVRLAGVGADTTTAIATGGDAQGDILIGIEGLIGSAFDDTLTGNSINNILIGGLGNDVLDGRDGIDTADYSQDHVIAFVPTADRVDVHLGLNDAAGTATEFKALVGHFQQLSVDTLISIENVTGTGGPDTIVGNEKANTLDGRGSADTLDGGLGNDTLIGGGSGGDTASYASHNSLSGEFGTISLGLSDSVAGHANYFIPLVFNGFQTALNVETDTLFGIENIIGSSLNETLTGNGGDNILDGGLGNDTLVGNGGHDTASYVSHDTSIVKSGESDTISLGLNGADGSFTRSTVSNALGFHLPQVLESDVLRGITNVTGSNHSETINGNEQDNILDGRGGSDVLNGGAGHDTLIGGAGLDILNGGAGDDAYDFRGTGLETDFFFDESGTDTIFIDSFKDVLDAKQVGKDLVAFLTTGTFTIVNHFGGNAIETVQDATGTKIMSTNLIGGNIGGIIAGTDGGETLEGRGGDDILFGNGGKDTLLGGADNDVLDGGKGNDILDGGSGNDTLTGGNGHDTFVFAPVEPDGLPGGNDVITDFVHGQDKIDLTAFGTNLNELFGDHDGHSNHKGEGGQDAGPITIAAHGNDTVLSFEGGSIDIVGVHHLQANDFIL